MNEITRNGRPVTFQIDRYVHASTLGALSPEDRAELLASRGEAWHNDPDDYGIEGGLEYDRIAIDRYAHGNGIAVYAIDEYGDCTDVSENLDTPTTGLTFWENHNSPFTLMEMERAGIIRPTGTTTKFGPYGTESRLMEFTPAYADSVQAALNEN